ncbi:MAG: methylglyoxal synthase [Bdellovibrionota bacterium]
MPKPKKINQNSIKTIALIAHDGKKALLVSFVRDHMKILEKFNLIGTGSTGKLVLDTGLKIKRLLSGPLGGDAQIAAAVATGHCDGVIFLRDPLGMHPHDPDISMLMRICDVHNVPLATNPATAELMIRGLWKK